jgi:hypothetical protein
MDVGPPEVGLARAGQILARRKVIAVAKADLTVVR